MQTIKPGDIIYCEFISFGGKRNRPAIVLDVKENYFYCLRITKTEQNNSIFIDTEDLFECCKALTGFIYLNPTKIEPDMCVSSYCSDCKISFKLKIILIQYGIKF